MSVWWVSDVVCSTVPGLRKVKIRIFGPLFIFYCTYDDSGMRS